MEHRFTKSAAEDYQYWLKVDSKKIERIKLLIADIKQNHPRGVGKPEPLRYQKSGVWSRRVDREHRLVYSVENDILTVYSCRFHYGK